MDFAACIIAALAVRAEAFVIAPDAPAVRATELCAIEGGSAVLCDDERSARLVGGTRRPCGPGLVLVETAPQSPCRAITTRVRFTSSPRGPTADRRASYARRRRSELEESTVGSHLGMAPGCTVLCAVPATHGYGYTAGLFAPLVVRRHRDRGAPAAGRVAGQAAEAAPARDRRGGSRAVRRVVGAATGVRRTAAAALVVRRSAAAPRRASQVQGRLGRGDRRAVRDDRVRRRVRRPRWRRDARPAVPRASPSRSTTTASGEAVGEVVVDAPYGPRGYIGDHGRRRSRARSPATASGVATAVGSMPMAGCTWSDAEPTSSTCAGRRSIPRRSSGRSGRLTGCTTSRSSASTGPRVTSGSRHSSSAPDSITDDALDRATEHLESFKRPQRVIRLLGAAEEQPPEPTSPLCARSSAHLTPTPDDRAPLAPSPSRGQ